MSTVSITKDWQSEPKTILVDSIPVQERQKLSNQSKCQSNQKITWEDLSGLSWIFFDEV